MNDQAISRRRFLQHGSAGLTLAGVTAQALAASGDPALGGQAKAPPPVPNAAPENLARSLKAYNIWDGHCHPEGFSGETPEARMEDMLRFADRMSVDRMCVFLGYPFNFRGTADDMRAQNDQVMKAVAHSGGRAYGYAYMNPGHPQACLDEINRCVRDGPMIGLKFELGNPQLANVPEMDPLIARIGELKGVVMHHTWIKTTGQEEGESTPTELVELARRHPTVTIFCGHTGGNWELGIRTIRTTPNLYADTCGSDPIAGFTEMAIRELGVDRVIYGSDVGGRSFASQLGKIMGADLPDRTRRQILGENLRRILRPTLEAKGMKV